MLLSISNPGLSSCNIFLCPTFIWHFHTNWNRSLYITGLRIVCILWLLTPFTSYINDLQRDVLNRRSKKWITTKALDLSPSSVYPLGYCCYHLHQVSIYQMHNSRNHSILHELRAVSSLLCLLSMDMQANSITNDWSIPAIKIKHVT